jgi:rod shape-determining protein MreD
MSPETAGWRHMVAMAALFLGALFSLAAQLAPLGLYAGAHASPDLVWCVVAYVALRRPGAAHPLLVFGVGLLQDMLTTGPFGAGVLTMLLMSEFLRAQSHWLCRRPILFEWFVVSLTALAMMFLQWLMLTISFADPPALLELAPRLGLTILAFPLVAAAFRYLLRIGAVSEDEDGRYFGAS